MCGLFKKNKMLNDSFLFKRLKPKDTKKIVRATITQTSLIGVKQIEAPSENELDESEEIVNIQKPLMRAATSPDKSHQLQRQI